MKRARLSIATVLFGVLCTLVYALPTAAANAPALQSLDSIAAAARGFAVEHGLKAGARRTVEIAALDSRLRLAACVDPLAVAAAPGARSNLRMTVEVRCPSPGGWRLFVPVVIKAFDTAVIATRALPRGHVLTAQDMNAVESQVSALPAGYSADPGPLVGRRLMRPVGAGTVIGSGAVFIEPTVRRGQAVTLLAQAQGFSVRMQGIALAAGGVDERIKIKNLSSGREVEGVVRADSLVEVPLN